MTAVILQLKHVPCYAMAKEIHKMPEQLIRYQDKLSILTYHVTQGYELTRPTKRSAKVSHHQIATSGQCQVHKLFQTQTPSSASGRQQA